MHFRGKTWTELHTILSLRDPDVVDLTEQSSATQPTETSHKVSLLSWRSYNFYPENFWYKAHGSHSTAIDCLIEKFGRYSKYLALEPVDIVPLFFAHEQSFRGAWKRKKKPEE